MRLMQRSCVHHRYRTAQEKNGCEIAEKCAETDRLGRAGLWEE
jgi:hypothetical protein